MRALGVDFGERRIGLAISDADGRLALPFGVVERTTDRRAVYQIADLSRRESVELLVVGLPRGLPEVVDAGRDETIDRVRRFGAKLERATRLPVRFVDETLTTVEAIERLGAADRADRPERRDAVAAQILLQEALDRGPDRGFEDDGLRTVGA